MTAPLTIATSEGAARVQLAAPDEPAVGAVLLGHGAGGGVDAPDLRVARGAALQSGWAVALVEQPYRVAGRRSAAPAPRLDAAWAQVIAELAGPEGPLVGLRLVTGGRSSGARVACRTALQTGAAGVLCAWPFHCVHRRAQARPSHRAAANKSSTAPACRCS